MRVQLLTMHYGRYTGESLCRTECWGKCDQPKTLQWRIRAGTLRTNDYNLLAENADSDGLISQPLYSFYESLRITVEDIKDETQSNSAPDAATA